MRSCSLWPQPSHLCHGSFGLGQLLSGPLQHTPSPDSWNAWGGAEPGGGGVPRAQGAGGGGRQMYVLPSAVASTFKMDTPPAHLAQEPRDLFLPEWCHPSCQLCCQHAQPAPACGYCRLGCLVIFRAGVPSLPAILLYLTALYPYGMGAILPSRSALVPTQTVWGLGCSKRCNQGWLLGRGGSTGPGKE